VSVQWWTDKTRSSLKALMVCTCETWMKSRKQESVIVGESPTALVLTGNNGPLTCVGGHKVHESP
jgi:hypothetical protein